MDRCKSPQWKRILEVLANPTVSELEANGPDLFFIKQSGERKRIVVDFGSVEEYEQSIHDGLIPLIKTQDRFNENNFLFEGPLAYECGGQQVRGRCHISLRPVADNALITIAKKSTSINTLDKIESLGTMSPEMNRFIKKSVQANLSMIISGGTGSGKDLHVDTIIPTPGGYKKLADINVGDVVFDENGAQTRVNAKYAPRDPRHYELTFSNGQIIKAGEGHLWKICAEDEDWAERLVTTKELFDLKFGGQIILIPRPIKPIQSANPALVDDAYDLGIEVGKGGADAHQIIRDMIFTSPDSRIKFLQGICDSKNTTTEDKGVVFLFVSPSIVFELNSLIASLGWITFNIKDDDVAGRVAFVPNTQIFLRNKEKAKSLAESLLLSQKDPYQHILVTAVAEIVDNPEDYYCLGVESDTHMFLCTEMFIPTHNTTLLEAISKEWEDSTRIGVAEDTPELVLSQSNVIYQHSRPARPGLDASQTASLSFVVQQLNRQRVDKIIVGETRGREFAEFLVAANSGCEGSLSTIHANNPRRALAKMTNFGLQGSDGMPIRAVNQDIAFGIDLIIQIQKMGDGIHRITAIEEVTNTVSSNEDAGITSQRLFEYKVVPGGFRKVMNPTDELRHKFDYANVDIQEFLNNTSANNEQLESLRLLGSTKK